MSDPTPCMSTIGKILAVVEEHGKVSATTVRMFPYHPLRGIGLLNRQESWRAAMAASGDELGLLFNHLPADLEDPKHGVKEDDLSAFWLGYYQRKNLRLLEGKFTSSTLAECGKLLWGEHWQQPMAEALGLSDTARIRSWLSGSQHVPIGIWSELDTLLRKRKSQISALLEAGKEQQGQDDVQK